MSAFVAIGTTVAAGVCLWMVYKYFKRSKLGKRATIKSLYIYPVKSCAAIKLDKVEITELGCLFDRSWVLVNGKGIMQTMRQIPKMALIKPSFNGKDNLLLDAPGMSTLKVSMNICENGTNKRSLEIWGLYGDGLDCGDEAGRWFDDFLGKPGHRLFSGRNENLNRRELKDCKVWGKSVKPDDKMIYQDSAPVMLVSEASLEAVNKELENPVDIRSFRPNIYIEGCHAFEEDDWQTVQIGQVILRKFRQNTRCVLTTVDMNTGVKRKDGEPLKTLKRTRVQKSDDPRYNQAPLFGNHFVADVLGTINVGDNVVVLV